MNNCYQPYYAPRLITKIFASGAIGNILETYDLILISLMGATLSKVFFPPSADPYAYMTNVLYVFLISLLVRPIGNIIMGSFADQIGRKKLMVISLVFTGIATIFIGLLPSYSYIGIWSTIIFIFLRIFQNFFAGIEYINSATYLIENSKKFTRGFYGSWTAIGISGGYLLASLVTLAVFYLIEQRILPEWGWRIVFLFSILGIVFGIWIRSSIPESMAFMLNNSATQQTKKWDIIKNSLCFIKDNFIHCSAIGAITLMGTCLSYIYYIYIPMQINVSRHFSHSKVFSLNVFSLTLIVILIPFFGKLSDLYNKIKLLKIVCLLTLILAMPFFWVAAYGTYFQILIFSLLISIPASCFFALYPVVVTESFPSRIRCSTASLIYQIVFSVEMGTIPILVNHLLKTNTPYSPGYILMISALIGLIGLLFFKQTIDDEEKNIIHINFASYQRN